MKPGKVYATAGFVMIFNELDMLKDGQDTGDDLAVGNPTEGTSTTVERYTHERLNIRSIYDSPCRQLLLYRSVDPSR